MKNKSFTSIRVNALFAQHEIIAGILTATSFMPLALHGNILLLLLALFAGIVVTVALSLWRESDDNRPDYLAIFLRRRFIHPRVYNPLEQDTAYKDLPPFATKKTP